MQSEDSGSRGKPKAIFNNALIRSQPPVASSSCGWKEQSFWLIPFSWLSGSTIWRWWNEEGRRRSWWSGGWETIREGLKCAISPRPTCVCVTRPLHCPLCTYFLVIPTQYFFCSISLSHKPYAKFQQEVGIKLIKCNIAIQSFCILLPWSPSTGNFSFSVS